MPLIKRRRASNASQRKPQLEIFLCDSPPPRLPSPKRLEHLVVDTAFLSASTSVKRRSRSFSDLASTSASARPSRGLSSPRQHSTRFEKSSLASGSDSGWRPITPQRQISSASDSSCSTIELRTPPRSLPFRNSAHPVPSSPTVPSFLLCSDIIPCAPTDYIDISPPSSPSGRRVRKPFLSLRWPKKSKPQVQVQMQVQPPVFQGLSDSRRSSSMQALEDWEAWMQSSESEHSFPPAVRPVAPQPKIIWGQAV